MFPATKADLQMQRADGVREQARRIRGFGWIEDEVGQQALHQARLRFAQPAALPPAVKNARTKTGQGLSSLPGFRREVVRRFAHSGVGWSVEM
jgi:hypothetical protein